LQRRIKAAENGTALAAQKVRLFGSLLPNPNILNDAFFLVGILPKWAVKLTFWEKKFT